MSAWSGAIRRQEDHTDFHLEVVGDSGQRAAQTVTVRNARLASFPNLYARILHFMVRDLEQHFDG